MTLKQMFPRLRGTAFPPASGPVRGRVLVLSEGENPSVDYFIRPALAAAGARCCLLDSRVAPAEVPEAWDAVVVVRYLPRRWIPLLSELRRRGVPVAYFMDDDLMDPAAHADLPAEYRRKLRVLALDRRAEIERLASEYWVSTEYLADKYREWQPRRLVPGMTAPPRVGTPVRLSYHGSASHPMEHQWLLALIAQLQCSRDDTHFTIIGDREINRQFRELPRVTVLHPLRWPSYCAHAAAYPCDIALAPLLPGAFNAARGPTKFFDFVRLGAAGVYADVAPYRGWVRHDVDGLLLPMDRDAWIEAIAALADDPGRRAALALAARNRALGAVPP